jgi:hypothetical protein
MARSYTSKLLRAAWRLNRAERMARNPARYARNRAKSRVLRATGFWKLRRAWWRA